MDMGSSSQTLLPGGESALTSLRRCWPGAQSCVCLKRSENVCAHRREYMCTYMHIGSLVLTHVHLCACRIVCV